MLAIVSPPPEPYANLIWYCSESSLIFGEFFYSPLKVFEWTAVKSWAQCISMGEEKIHKKLTKRQQLF